MGTTGTAGKDGSPAGPDAQKLAAIDPDQFAIEWLKPSITKLTPASSPMGRAVEGETVSITGGTFTTTDMIEIQNQDKQWVLSPTTVVGANLATFTVPVVSGGINSVRLRQQDNTTSNEISLEILPVVTGTIPAGRITPGAKAQLTGTGFSKVDGVHINGFTSAT